MPNNSDGADDVHIVISRDAGETWTQPIKVNDNTNNSRQFQPWAAVDKSGKEAFAVIRDAMKDKGRVALAGIIFANRQHILAVEPWGKGMLGTTICVLSDAAAMPVRSFLAKFPEEFQAATERGDSAAA